MPNTEHDETLHERYLHLDDELELRREQKQDAEYEEDRENRRGRRYGGH